MAGQKGSITRVLPGWRLLLVCCLLYNIVGVSQAQSGKVYDIDLQAQRLADALNGLSEQTGAPVVFPYDLVRDRTSSPVAGRYTLLDALKALLKDTGLSGGLSDKGVLMVSPVKPSTPQPGETFVKEQTPNNSNKSSAARPLGVAAFFASVAAAFSASAADDVSNSPALEEVLVTAQKRGEERLQDVPVPISVVQAEDLLSQNQLRIQDFFSEVPGLNITAAGAQGSQLLTIRGISTGTGNSATVGVVVDDIPFGGSSSGTGDFLLPDIDPNDLARIEVLRGPQGTLYGAESMGGLLKFVTVDPSTEKFSGRLQAGTSTVYNGAELGYNARASVNIPLGDTFALRASGFTRREPGYIDNPFLGIDGINEKKVNGGRLAALWRPADNVSLKVSALYQRYEAGAYDDVELAPGVGPWQQDFLRNTGANDRSFAGLSAIFTAKLDGITFTSLSGYSSTRYRDSWDWSYAYSDATVAQFGVAGVPFSSDSRNYKINQELRFSGSFADKVDWLLAGYFAHDHTLAFTTIAAEDPVSGAIVGTWAHWILPFSYKEYAAFGDLTFHFTERFDVQIGARESYLNVVNEAGTQVGPLVGASTPQPVPEADSKEHSFTYLFTPRFKLTPDLMVYARLASGFRPGTANPPSTTTFIPPQVRPDTTRNYELGLKGDFFDHRLSADASIYYIDWRDIQVYLVDQATQLGYNGNGSHAKSQGGELSLQWRPWPQSTIGAWVSFDEAVLTKPLPPSGGNAYGTPGTRLPFSSRFSGNFFLRQGFPLWADATGFMEGSVSWVGDRLGQFAPDAVSPRQDYPGYAQANLLVGVLYRNWSLDLSATNIANRRGLIGGGIGQYPPSGLVFIQPRTVGLSVAYKF